MIALVLILEIVAALVGLAVLSACFILAGKAADNLGDGFLSLYSFMVCVFIGLGSVVGTILFMASLPGWLNG